MNSGTKNTDKTNNTDKGNIRFDWLLPILIHPKKTIEEIVKKDKPVWLTSLMVISALVIIAGLVGSPIRKNDIISGANLPENFQYYSAEQQAQFMSAQATQSSALFTLVFPIVGSLIGVWFSWFILSSILHLLLTLSGSRASNIHSVNLVGWAMIPIAVRQLIQIFAMIFTHSVVHASGFSGFIASDVTGGLAFLSGILGQLDIFFIWQVVLILLGVVPLSGLKPTKAWAVTAAAILILMVLVALPRMASSMMSGLTTGGFFF